MAEGLTFANFAPDQDQLIDIYGIGEGDGSNDGVVEEIATAFSYELTATPVVDNLGDLISRVGPAKELQENIGLVQEALGTDEDAVAITRGWAERSGLLIPVARSYMTAEQLEGHVELAVMTGGVRNWIARRAEQLIASRHEYNLQYVLLIAGNRVMKATEGPDVEEGMTEADYMRLVVAERLQDLGLAAKVTAVDSGVGDEVMEQGIKRELRYIDTKNARIAVVSNAGSWVQNAGQMRRAIRKEKRAFDRDGSQLHVISDSFPLGTGAEPTSTHQNPFSAVSQIVRNAQELARHTA